VRAHARESGTTISAVVTRALTEFLARERGDHSAVGPVRLPPSLL
jgi:hypothetical protein